MLDDLFLGIMCPALDFGLVDPNMIRKGLDISHYQTVTSWPAVADQVAFVYHKASEGRSSDPKMVTTLAAAREQALSVGGYHFFRPDVVIDTQLKTFFAQLEAARIGDGDLVPALDVEPEPPLLFTPAVYVSGVVAMVQGIIKEYRKCVLYCTQRDWHTLGNPDILLDPNVFLWVAHYTLKAAPACPPGKTWTMWQHGTGPCPGITSSDGVDLDVAAVLPVLGRASHPDDTLALVGETLRQEAEALWAQGHPL